MSCLNKLLPSRKAWKIFTDKFQSKLRKLNRSKTIKKSKRSRLNKTKNKRNSWPGFSFHLRVEAQHKRLKLIKPSQTLHYHTTYFPKRPSTVYIDQLFIETVVSEVKEHSQPPIKAAPAHYNNGSKEEAACASSAKKAELVGMQENIAGTSCTEDGTFNEEMHSADDMWESLVLASPQMNGINERAEEFIRRFRAEMQLQEQLAHL